MNIIHGLLLVIVGWDSRMSLELTSSRTDLCCWKRSALSPRRFKALAIISSSIVELQQLLNVNEFGITDLA